MSLFAILEMNVVAAQERLHKKVLARVRGILEQPAVQATFARHPKAILLAIFESKKTPEQIAQLLAPAVEKQSDETKRGSERLVELTAENADLRRRNQQLRAMVRQLQNSRLASRPARRRDELDAELERELYA